MSDESKVHADARVLRENGRQIAYVMADICLRCRMADNDLDFVERIIKQFETEAWLVDQCSFESEPSSTERRLLAEGRHHTARSMAKYVLDRANATAEPALMQAKLLRELPTTNWFAIKSSTGGAIEARNHMYDTALAAVRRVTAVRYRLDAALVGLDQAGQEQAAREHLLVDAVRSRWRWLGRRAARQHQKEKEKEEQTDNG